MTRPAYSSSLRKSLQLPGYCPFKTAAPGDYYDEKIGNEACDFFAKLLKHSIGEHAGKPFELEKWQKAIISNLFGWIRKGGTRRFRRAYIEVPKKNGKSTIAAGIALKMLVGDGEASPEVYLAASSRDQAAICGEAVKEMVRNSDVLSGILKTYHNTISCQQNHGVIKILSADAGTKHGHNISCVILDELHTFNTADLYHTLTKGVISRRQPLVIAITTAGYDRNTICWEIHEYAEKVRDGGVNDHEFLPVLYGAPVDADWKDPKVWAAANPNLGVSVKVEALESECKLAQAIPGHQRSFQQLHLCQWVNSKKSWIGKDAWDACKTEGLDAEWFYDKPLYIGLDLSKRVDLTAMHLLHFDDDGHAWTWPHFYCPEEGIERRARIDRVNYDLWAQQGYITATPGSAVDYQYLLHQIREVAKIANVIGIGYDPYGATQLAIELQSEGLPMIEVRQGYITLNEPSKELEILVLGKKLHHGGHPVMDWCVGNTVIVQDPAGNIKASKAASTERIDGVASLITALALRVHSSLGNGKSIYESQGLDCV